MSKKEKLSGREMWRRYFKQIISIGLLFFLREGWEATTFSSFISGIKSIPV